MRAAIPVAKSLEDTLHVFLRTGEDTGAPYLTLRRLAVWVCADCLVRAAAATLVHVCLRAGEDMGAPYLTLQRLAG